MRLNPTKAEFFIFSFSLILSVNQVGAMGFCKFAKMFPNPAEKCNKCDKANNSNETDSTVPVSLKNRTRTPASPEPNAFSTTVLSEPYPNSKTASTQPYPPFTFVTTEPYASSTHSSTIPYVVSTSESYTVSTLVSSESYTVSTPASAESYTVSTLVSSESYTVSTPASSESYIASTPISSEPYDVFATAPCPPNMVYGNCSNCQATCELPRVNVQCYSNCSEGCACANGFIQQGLDNCVSPSECACFVSEGFVLADGTEDYVNKNCTQQCNCSNGHLHCDLNYKCDPRAICELREGARRCYCVDGYIGDGKTCLPYSDCADAYISGHREDGTYPILPVGWPYQPFNVSCDMATNGGGWTVFQRRRDNSLSFYRNWDDYKTGFGFLDGNFWLGNEKLLYLTNQKNYELRIEIHGPTLGATYAAYSLFRTGTESNNYILSELGEFSGSIGHDYMSFHHRGYFNTFDKDNDDEPDQNCAMLYKGGWWYKDCYDANLNGVYGLSDDWEGICLYNRDTTGAIFDITFVEMKLKEIVY